MRIAEIIQQLEEERAEIVSARRVLDEDIGRLTAAIIALQGGAAVLYPEPVVKLPKPAVMRSAKKVAKPASSTPGRTKHDYAKVADVARKARGDGRAMSTAVAVAFGVSGSMASFMVIEARQRGFDVPKGQLKVKKPTVRPAPVVQPAVKVVEAARPVPALTGPPPSDLFVDDRPTPAEPPYGYAQVAEFYREVEDTGQPIVRTMSDRYDVSAVAVNAWIRECRDRQLLPARGQPVREDRVAPAGAVNHRGSGGMTGVTVA